MYDIHVIANWITLHSQFSFGVILIIGFIEAFTITGTFWSSFILLIVATSFHGSFFGDNASFLLGYFLGPKIKKISIIKKREKFLNKTEKTILKYGWIAIIIGRFTPAIRPYVPFLASIAKMRYHVFLNSAILACTLWSLTLGIIIIGIDKIIIYFN
jgi:membrane-associated protein